jgi:uncharacterized protein YcgI (DUF1989 family)
LELKAEMDLLCAMSACPMDVIAPTNGWVCTPLKVEIYKEEEKGGGK